MTSPISKKTISSLISQPRDLEATVAPKADGSKAISSDSVFRAPALSTSTGESRRLSSGLQPPSNQGIGLRNETLLGLDEATNLGSPNRSRSERDVLDSAIRMEEHNQSLPAESANGTVKGYHGSTPTRRERNEGATNCSSWLADVLADAGYDTSRTISYELPDGSMSEATVEDWVNIRAEEESDKHRAENEDFIPVLPEVMNPPNGGNANRVLRGLINNDDPRIQGAPFALDITGQGTLVAEWDGIRPGDVLQTWTATGGGHSTIVHTIKGIDSDGNEVFLGPDSSLEDYENLHLRNVQLEVIGSHLPKGTGLGDLRHDSDGILPGDSIYVKDILGEEVHHRWYAARPNGSDWNQ